VLFTLLCLRVCGIVGPYHWFDVQQDRLVPVKLTTLKDNDFKRALRLERQTAFAIKDQLDADTKFLCEQDIMDYSLLIGIHHCEVSLQFITTLSR